jgi:hypothetical protein
MNPHLVQTKLTAVSPDAQSIRKKAESREWISELRS